WSGSRRARAAGEAWPQWRAEQSRSVDRFANQVMGREVTTKLPAGSRRDGRRFCRATSPPPRLLPVRPSGSQPEAPVAYAQSITSTAGRSVRSASSKMSLIVRVVDDSDNFLLRLHRRLELVERP